MNTVNNTTKEKKFYKKLLNIPLELEEPLKEKAFKKSTPDHIYTISEYIIELIRKDIEEKD